MKKQETKVEELVQQDTAVKVENVTESVETKDPNFVIEKVTRSCDRSISVNYQTYKVSTTLSASIRKPTNTDELDKISREVYSLAEKYTLEEINKIREVLGR